MRVVALLCLVAIAGCLDRDLSDAADAPSGCGTQEMTEHTLWFHLGHQMLAEPPTTPGRQPGNGFAEAFLTNDLSEWLSQPVAAGMWILGNVTLEFWAEAVGTPAPVLLGGEPGEGYHFFNQFGNGRAFQPAYAVEYASAAPEPGAVLHFVETFEMPPGGFVVEAGDRVRVLLTDLALNGPDGSGHDILFGGETPSRVTFQARCYDSPAPELSSIQHDVALTGNQGLLTGQVPAREGVNTVGIPFALEQNSTRLEIVLEQTGGPRDPKQDIDMAIVDAAGDTLWGASSPYTDETFVLYPGNLEHDVPPGDYTLRIDSYSGTHYEGQVTISQG